MKWKQIWKTTRGLKNNMEPYNGIIVAVIYLVVETLKFFGKNTMAKQITDIKEAITKENGEK